MAFIKKGEMKNNTNRNQRKNLMKVIQGHG